MAQVPSNPPPDPAPLNLNPLPPPPLPENFPWHIWVFLSAEYGRNVCGIWLVKCACVCVGASVYLRERVSWRENVPACEFPTNICNGNIDLLVTSLKTVQKFLRLN